MLFLAINQDKFHCFMLKSKVATIVNKEYATYNFILFKFYLIIERLFMKKKNSPLKIAFSTILVLKVLYYFWVYPGF